MKDRVRATWDHLRQNLGDHITIVLSIIFGVLGITGAVKPEIGTAGILAVLALLSLSNKNERRRELDLHQQVEKLMRITEQGNRITAERFSYEAVLATLLIRNRARVMGLEMIGFDSVSENALGKSPVQLVVEQDKALDPIHMALFRAIRTMLRLYRFAYLV